MDCTARFFLGKMSLKLGESIPESAKHAVSVSLPLWSDNVAYEEGDVRVTKLLKGGYPRFVFHSYVEKLFKYFERRFTRSLDEACMVLCSRSAAQDCRDYIKKIEKDASVRLVEQTLSTSHHPAPISSTDPYVTLNANPITLYIIVLPRNLFKLAKSFWQHSGEIISSRYAEHCLRIVDGNVLSSQFGPETTRYSSSELYKLENQHSTSTEIFTKAQESESNIFVEERYARNMDYRMGELAKVSLRKRIAGVLGDHIEISRKGLTEDDVYLYPTGMSAIYNCHRIIQKMYPKLHTVQFGFCYLDTLKIQQKFGSCHFLGNGDDNDMKKLENDILPTQKISALFCEFPSNPLLKSVDLKKLASLADKYGFILVIDETIGNFLNVSVVEWADVVVSSLTKIFSGDSNVMGGAMILNPKSNHYATLKKELNGSYIDCIWLEDAIFLERNSRSFKERNIRINEIAELLVDYLKGLEIDSIVEIFYPKYTTSEAYLQCKTDSGGFGGLFSIAFRTEEQSSRFYDALDIRKGPSLGTNFTLACPYTILAHYHELSWAAEFGVSKFLVRVSVGLEDFEDLKNAFRRAAENI